MPADLARLFVPFGRASNARDANIPGLGLGLYVSRRLAEAHGGSLRATSDGEGHGSTFTLVLPVRARSQRPPFHLLVDEGYEVHMAETGQAGLVALGEFAPDLVLLDLMMPTMDGATFAREMERVHHPVPIVVLSGSREIFQLAQEMGAAGAILKPFDIDDFIRTVSGAIPG